MHRVDKLARKRAQRFFEVKNLELPVDIEKIIRQYADIEEDYIPFGGDAVCINLKGRPLIVLNKYAVESRRRFTLAHELGHIQIPWHTGMLSCHTDADRDPDLSKFYQIEREANIFAAELLMPHYWLRDLVRIKKDLDIKELIDIICEQAQVSFSAALYNLINILPSGYVIFIQNKKENYLQRKITGNIVRPPVFLYNDEHDNDLDWILFNSCENGKIEHELLTVYWFKYKEIISKELIDVSVKKLSNANNLTDVLENIFKMNYYSVAFSLSLLVDKLPSGYIIEIIYRPTGNSTCLRSKETYVNPKGTNDWYNEYCEELGEYVQKQIVIKWWFFKTTYEFNISNELPDSKSILRNIIDNCYSKDERKSIYGMVNGIIGNLNNSINKMDSAQFFSILKQKFLGRNKLASVTSHKDFNHFLAKKTSELYKK